MAVAPSNYYATILYFIIVSLYIFESKSAIFIKYFLSNLFGDKRALKYTKPLCFILMIFCCSSKESNHAMNLSILHGINMCHIVFIREQRKTLCVCISHHKHYGECMIEL